MVFLDGFEQGLEVALAETVVSLTLDDLEEDRTDHRLGEDLQQHAQLTQLLDVLLVIGHLGIELLVVGIRGGEELDVIGLERPDRGIDAVGGHGQVLDALAEYSRSASMPSVDGAMHSTNSKPLAPIGL